MNRASQTGLTGRSNVVDRRGSSVGVDHVMSDKTEKPHKVLIDGKIYIVRKGRVYTPQGQMVK